MNHLNLGASLYVPATRTDLEDIARGTKLGQVRSLIVCLEDSVSDNDLEGAIANLGTMLASMNRDKLTGRGERLLFARPRNVQVLRRMLVLPGIELLQGFVIPKATADSLPEYLDALAHAGTAGHFSLMPTLETKEAFDMAQMTRLRDILLRPDVKDTVLALRIGGNDLLNVLGVRRSRHRTLYESPIAHVIAQLVSVFKPWGFALTSPVCEILYDHEVLERELAQDLEHGLCGKTAIHPDQVSIIEGFYRPAEQDVRMATAILAEGAPAVFNMCGTMCEVATHRHWASDILARSRIYGVYGKDADVPAPRLTQAA